MAISTGNVSALNNYTVRPRNLTQYTAFRGVTDFTNIGQFDQYETGYAFLSVLQMPKFMTELARLDPHGYGVLVNSFQHMLEYEFRGMDGLADITAESSNTITDGINEMNMISTVKMDTSIQVSSTYYERRGSLITKFAEEYLTGIKDRMTQAKTYHGLIANGILEPSYENEVFTMLFYVTDNTFLQLERAILLCNMQLTKAETSMYNTTRGEIANKEMNIEWNAYPIMGYEVDKAASVLLQDITGVKVSYDDTAGNVTRKVVNTEGVAVLDSNNYRYGIMNSASAAAIEPLTEAIARG